MNLNELSAAEWEELDPERINITIDTAPRFDHRRLIMRTTKLRKALYLIADSLDLTTAIRTAREAIDEDLYQSSIRRPKGGAREDAQGDDTDRANDRVRTQAGDAVLRPDQSVNGMRQMPGEEMG